MRHLLALLALLAAVHLCSCSSSSSTMLPSCSLEDADATASTTATVSTTSGSATSTNEQHQHPESLMIDGVDVPYEQVLANGQRLLLNGAGTRSIQMLGMDFKIYVASFYTHHSVPPPFSQACIETLVANNTTATSTTDTTGTDTAAPDDSSSMILDFTFLRTVSKYKVAAAWQQQLQHSISHVYDNLERDRSAFVGMFGAMQSGGTQRVFLTGNNETHITDQGIYKGVVHGQHWQHAFLSVWFGERAAQADLKTSLLSLSRRRRRT